jgi:TP901 family phage tail tape measure protein
MLGSASAQITLDIGQFIANANKAEASMNQLAQAGTQGAGGRTVFDRLNSGALGLGTALIAPMALGLKTAVDLEQQMANVDAALGDISDSDLSNLAGQFNDIAINSQYSAVQVAAVSEELAKAGFAAPELASTTQAVVDLAQATGTSLPSAVGAVSQAMNTWQESIVGTEIALTDASRVADIYTVAANNSSASVEDIAVGMRSLGPVAASMGISFEESAAAVALFTNYGLKGADAGISLARGLQNLADPTTEAATLMDELGIAAFDLEGNFVGFPSLFDQLNTSMADMSDEAQLAALSTIFGAEAIDVMGLALLQGASPLEQMIKLMGEQGAAAESSAIRMDTLGAQFGTLKEGIATLLGSLVSGLIPGMRLFVDFANTVVDALLQIPGPIKTVIGAVAGLLASFAAVTRGIQAFRAINGIMGSLAANSGTAAVASRGLLGTIARFVPALALISAGFLIWKANLFDVQGKFAGFMSGVKKFGNSFIDTFRNLTTATYKWGDTVDDIRPTMRIFPALFVAFGNALGKIGGPKGLPILRDIGKAFLDLGMNLDRGLSTWTRLRAEGIDPVTAGLTALTSAFPALQGVVMAIEPIIGQVREAFNGFPAVVSDLNRAFSAFVSGDYASAFVILGGVIGAAFENISDFAGVIDDVVVTLGSWVLNIGIPAIVSVGWDIVGAIMDWLPENIIVPLSNWIAQLNGAEIVAGTIDLAGDILDWITANPIPAVLIPASLLALAFFGPIGLVTLALVGGLTAAIILATQEEIPSEVAVPVADLVIALAGFTVTVTEFGGEVMFAVGLHFAKLRSQWTTFWDGVTLPTINLGPFEVNLDQPGSILTSLMDQVSDILEGDLQTLSDRMQAKLNQWGANPELLIPNITIPTAGTGSLQGISDGLMTSLDRELADVNQGLYAELQSWADGITGFFDDLSIPDVTMPEFSIEWPDLPSLDDVPYVSDLIGLIGDLRTMVSGMDITIEMPDINIDWPSLDSITDAIPDYIKDLVTMNPIDWAKKYLNFDKKEFTGAGYPGRNNGGGEGYEMPFMQPDSGILAHFTNMIRLAGEVRTAAGEAKAAIDGMFSGGGGRGAVGGGGGGAGAFTAELAGVQTALTSLTAQAMATGLQMLGVGAQVGQAFISGLSLGLAMAAGTLASALSALLATVTGSAPSFQGGGVLVGISTAVGIGMGLSQGAGSVRGGLTSLLATVTGMAGAYRGAGTLLGLNTAQGIASGIASGSGAIRGALGAIVGIVAGFAGAMRSAGVGVGVALGQGIAAGIQSMIGSIAASAAAAVRAAVGAAQAAGGIRSPSTVMRDQVGVNLALGVAEGIIAGVPAVINASERLLPYVPVGTYAYGPSGGQVYGGSGGMNVQINQYIDGTDDPEAVAELAGVRVMQALVHLNAEVTR